LLYDLWSLRGLGRLGVLIFFVLSGFLITYLLLCEYEENGFISVKKFYIRRVLRIWPLYFFSIILALIIYHYLFGQAHPYYHSLLLYFTFLSNFDVVNALKENVLMQIPSSLRVTWSISVEEQFYLLWPLLFAFIPKKRWSIPILIVLLFSSVFRFMERNDTATLEFHTFSVLVALAIGGGYAYMIKQNISFRSFFESTNTVTHLFSFIVAFFLYRYFFRGWMQEIVIEIVFGFIIASQALTKKRSILNLSNIKFATNFGKYTYAIYLLHPIALALVDHALIKFNLVREAYPVIVLEVIMGFTLTMIFAMASYRFLETPFLRMKEKFTLIKTANKI